MDIILWLIAFLFSIWLVASPLVCLYWVFRPAEWFWWKHRYISKVIGFGAFFGCVGVITLGVNYFLWFIPDKFVLELPHWCMLLTGAQEIYVARFIIASLIGFFGTFALWTVLENACNDKRRRDREDRISLYKSYKKRDLHEGKKTIADFKRRKEELNKLWNEGKLSPFGEEELIEIEQVLEEWDKKENSLFEELYEHEESL